MTIQEILVKIKSFGAKLEETPIYISLVIILVAMSSFGLGRLSYLEEKRPSVKIENDQMQKTNGGTVYEVVNAVTASKNGTKYYYPWCSGIDRISPENKISFSSKDEAEKAGYTIASGCTAP